MRSARLSLCLLGSGIIFGARESITDLFRKDIYQNITAENPPMELHFIPVSIAFLLFIWIGSLLYQRYSKKTSLQSASSVDSRKLLKLPVYLLISTFLYGAMAPTLQYLLVYKTWLTDADIIAHPNQMTYIPLEKFDYVSIALCFTIIMLVGSILSKQCNRKTCFVAASLVASYVVAIAIIIQFLVFFGVDNPIVAMAYDLYLPTHIFASFLFLLFIKKELPTSKASKQSTMGTLVSPN